MNRRLREQLERDFPPDYAAWLRHLAAERGKLHRSKQTMDEKRAILGRLSSAAAYRNFTRSQAEKSRVPQVRGAKRS